jgi:hypothetical protein
MSINTSASPKVIPIRRVLLTGLIVILSITVTAGFVRMQTDHVIAPPGLRLIDAYWRFFVCRCPVFPDLLSF